MTQFPSANHVSILHIALELQKKASEVGLDWPEADTVWASINQELAEAKAASEDISVLASRIEARAVREGRSIKSEELDSAYDLLKEELGDLLFAVVDVCRTLKIDPGDALKTATIKFQDCFEYVTEQTSKEGILLGLENPDRLKQLWRQARHVKTQAKSIPIKQSQRENIDEDLQGSGAS